METIFLSDVGRVRQHNEDAGGIYIHQTSGTMAIVADGMGGHQAGDVASMEAVDIIRDSWQLKGPFTSYENVETWLSDILKEANRLIYQKAEQYPNYEGMGTTVVIAVCTYGFITLAHIGDSRGYACLNHDFSQVTQDHSLVGELLRSGQLTADEARNHPQKNIVLKALGTEKEVTPDIQTISWANGDKLLLCSDGLTDKVNESELEDKLTQDTDIDATGKELIELANERGGEDNISLAIVLNDTGTKRDEAS